MSREPEQVGVIVEDVIEQIQREVYGPPIDLRTCGPEVRRGYDQGSRDGFDRGYGVGQREAYDAGHADGWRAGAAFAARSDELTEQTRATIEASIEAFRADHEKRRNALSGGGAR